jgi:hypothetical protein
MVKERSESILGRDTGFSKEHHIAFWTWEGDQKVAFSGFLRICRNMILARHELDETSKMMVRNNLMTGLRTWA